MERRGWNDARLAQEFGAVSGIVAKLLYGERRAGRKLARKCFEVLGTPYALWDEPCPVAERSHRRDESSAGLIDTEDDALHARAAS